MSKKKEAKNNCNKEVLTDCDCCCDCMPKCAKIKIVDIYDCEEELDEEARVLDFESFCVGKIDGLKVAKDFIKKVRANRMKDCEEFHKLFLKRYCDAVNKRIDKEIIEWAESLDEEVTSLKKQGL